MLKKNVLKIKKLVATALLTNESFDDCTAQQSSSSTLAISHGSFISQTVDRPVNLTQVLQQAAEKSPDKGITLIQTDGSEIIQTYPILLAEAKRISSGLKKSDLQPQDKVIFQFDHPQDFIPAFWGCIIGGFVPVPVSTAPIYEPDNSAVKKLRNAWQLLSQPLILTTKEIATQLQSLSEKLKENWQVAIIDNLNTEPEKLCHQAKSSDLALLLLTSGSTGMPKGVTLSHSNLLGSVIGTSEAINLTEADISLNWLPLDHPGPLIRCVIRSTYLRVQQIHAPTALILANPLKWLVQPGGNSPSGLKKAFFQIN